MEQNSETEKPPDVLKLKNSELRCTEVTVLNMEVETLRWQLAQVYFLNSCLLVKILVHKKYVF